MKRFIAAQDCPEALLLAGERKTLYEQLPRSLLRGWVITLFLFISLLCASDLYPVSGDEIFKKFQARMRDLSKLTGVISWKALDGKTYIGNFTYYAPNRIYVKFTSPVEKILVSNGKTLWIYTHGSRVCGMYELIKGPHSGILSMIRTGYSSAAVGGDAGYVIKLKSDTKQYREVVLSMDPTYLLKAAIFKREDNRMLSFSISDASTKVNVDEDYFNFKVPKGVQVIKNPLNVK
jgi:outer membrane lipoprotein-sorting protein